MDESQFILRLPDPLVERMRFALSSNKNKHAAGEDKKVSKFGIEFTDTRNATFTVDGESYPASLMDLPCIVETHKTADKRTFFKSGDLHQVLVVRMPGERAPTNQKLAHGLTPAARDAAARTAEPPRIFPPKQVESVEHRVKYVLDHKVKFVAKKDTPPPPEEEEEELEIEEEASAPVEVSTTGIKASAAKPPLQPQQSPVPMEEFQLSSTPLLSPPLTAASPSIMDPSPAPDALMTPDMATPLPENEDQPDGEVEQDVDDEADDEDDDFAEMADALMEDDEEEEAKKRIERANLDQKIADKKKEIEDVEKRASRAPNPVLKQRILAKRGDMQKELEELQKKRTELGDAD